MTTPSSPLIGLLIMAVILGLSAFTSWLSERRPPNE